MIEFAILGSGTMARIYGQVLGERADCRLRAVVGNRPEKTRELAAQLGAEGFPGGDYEAMYRACPEVTATIVATPEWVRTEPLTAALAHGQHVLLEKPFATDLGTAREVKSLLEQVDGVVELGHVLRLSARFQALHDAVARGDIGELRHCFARRNSNRVRAARVLGRTDLAFWLTPHDVDVCRWLIRAQGGHAEIEEVFARARGRLETEDDYLIANLRFAGPVDAVVEISWCAPPLSGAAPEARFEARGTRGFVEVADSDMNVRVYAEDGRVESPDTYEDYVVGHGALARHRGIFEQLVDHFVTRIAQGDTGGPAIDDGYQTVRICAMIRESLDTGRVVRAD